MVNRPYIEYLGIRRITLEKRLTLDDIDPSVPYFYPMNRTSNLSNKGLGTTCRELDYICTLEVQPPFFIGWFIKAKFSKDSKEGFIIIQKEPAFC